MPLNEFQNQFKTLMLDHPKILESPAPDFAALFACRPEELPERLKIYRTNIIGSLSDVLSSTFPAIKKLVGEAFFGTMARSFIFRSPPQAACLNIYGAGFDEFIKTYDPAKSLPYLADMATLEYALNQAYHAPDDTALEPQALRTADLENIQFTPRASAFLIQSDYALDALHAFCSDETQTPPQIEKPICLLVHRPELETQITPLSDDEFMLLQQLFDGKTFGTAVENTLKDYPDFDLPAFLQKHLQLETFKDTP